MSPDPLVATIRSVFPGLEVPETVPAEWPDRAAGRLRTLGIATTALLDELRPSEDLKRRLLAKGRSGLEKLRRGRESTLTREERQGLEAIVALQGRPAILIQEGHFLEPPAYWKGLLEPKRRQIEEAIPGVGRIDVKGHRDLDWVGTGFLTAEDVVLTNAHVVREFATHSRRQWQFIPGLTTEVDYGRELGNEKADAVPVKTVLGIHPRHDLALLRLEPSARTAPPLAIGRSAPKLEERRKVYVIGHPAWDGRRNDPEPMRRIFADVFNLKRVQPGEAFAAPGEHGLFHHDCSTLGGNSGSCVVDLETGRVIGLHAGGHYLRHNWAIALWALARDPLLKRAGVRFVDY